MEKYKQMHTYQGSIFPTKGLNNKGQTFSTEKKFISEEKIINLRRFDDICFENKKRSQILHSSSSVSDCLNWQKDHVIVNNGKKLFHNYKTLNSDKVKKSIDWGHGSKINKIL